MHRYIDHSPYLVCAGDDAIRNAPARERKSTCNIRNCCRQRGASLREWSPSTKKCGRRKRINPRRKRRKKRRWNATHRRTRQSRREKERLRKRTFFRSFSFSIERSTRHEFCRVYACLTVARRFIQINNIHRYANESHTICVLQLSIW